jgi:uncharacterized protein (DUF1778 family)
VKDHTARALDKPAAIGKKEKNDFIDRFACTSIVKDHTARALDKPAAIGKKEKNDFIDQFACTSIVQLPHPCSEKD